MYRFALSPRWIGLGLGMTMLAAVMVGLGLWQLDRFDQRHAINDRIDAASSAAPVPLGSVLPLDGTASADQAWTKVTVTGRFDPAHQVLARARTVNDNVGFEVLTPLVLADGSAVLVDRGWLAPPPSSASVPPTIPPAPTGEVTVVGRLHLPESRPDTPETFGGGLAVRRIDPATLAAALPYPVYAPYVTEIDVDRPFVGIEPDHENAAMNAGYVIQWWMFAGLTLFGFAYLVYREGKSRRAPDEASPWDDEPATARTHVER